MVKESVWSREAVSKVDIYLLDIMQMYPQKCSYRSLLYIYSSRINNIFYVSRVYNINMVLEVSVYEDPDLKISFPFRKCKGFELEI